MSKDLKDVNPLAVLNGEITTKIITDSVGEFPGTANEALEVTFNTPIPHIASYYYRATELKLNEVKQQSQFSDNCFTANAERLMFNFKNFGTPILLEEVLPHMNPDLPFNITKWTPNVGQLVLLGISKISPIVLSGISKVDGPDIEKYTEPFQYFVVGVFNKEFNNRFGMKVVYDPRVNPLNPKDPNNTVSLGQQDDPLSGYNLNKTYKELKSEIAKDKDSAAKEKVFTRLIVLADEMEIKAYTY